MSHRDMAWTTVSIVCYFCVYGLILLGIIGYTYDKSLSIKEWFKLIWKRRSLYAITAIQLCDEATDIGVLVLWGGLALDEIDDPKEKNIQNVDMILMTLLACIIILLRILCVILIAYWTKESVRRKDKLKHAVESILLGLSNLFVFKEIWVAQKANEREPTLPMRTAQWFESVFSIFTIMLQSIFLLRTHGSEGFSLSDSEQLLLMLSIAASVISSTNKYVWWDSKSFDISFKDPKINLKKCPPINVKYVARAVWRYLAVVSRLALLVSLWAVCGGFILSLCVFLFFVAYFVMSLLHYRREDENTLNIFINFLLYHLIASTWHEYVAVPSHMYVLHHFFENLFGFTLVTCFASFDFKCEVGGFAYCSDPAIRSYKNDFVLVFIIVGWATTLLNSLLFVYLAPFTKWGSDAGIRGPLFVFAAPWKFEAFAKHLESEFSQEIILYLAEFLLLKSVVLMRNPRLRTLKHKETYASLLDVPFYKDKHDSPSAISGMSVSSVSVPLGVESPSDAGPPNLALTMQTLMSSSPRGAQLPSRNSTTSLHKGSKQVSEMGPMLSTHHRTNCYNNDEIWLVSKIMNYRTKYTQKIFELRNVQESKLSKKVASNSAQNVASTSSIEFEWDDKWTQWIEMNALTDVNSFPEQSEVATILTEIGGEVWDSNGEVVGGFFEIYLKLFKKYIEEGGAKYEVNINGKLRKDATALAQKVIQSGSRSDLDPVDILLVLNEIAIQLNNLLNASFNRFRNSNALINAIAILDLDERFIFQQWRRKQDIDSNRSPRRTPQ